MTSKPVISKTNFFMRSTNIVSQELLGKSLYFAGKKAIITETESYIAANDPACHAFKAKTKRTEVMFGPAGRTYVYFIYGMYYCLNIVTEPEGFAAAVLIRGAQVTSPTNQYINGPGKLCRFFEINCLHNNINITDNKEFFIEDIGLTPSFLTTRRVGISKGVDKLWRYVIDKPIL